MRFYDRTELNGWRTSRLIVYQIYVSTKVGETTPFFKYIDICFLLALNELMKKCFSRRIER